MNSRWARADSVHRLPRFWLWLILLAALAALLRLWLWQAYSPISFGDTPSYLRLAEGLAAGSLDGYDGTRVPGYPLFLALNGLDLTRVWAIQLLLGWLITLLLYWMGVVSTGNPVGGALLGALYNVIPGQFLWEAAILTETLTAFFVLLTVGGWMLLDSRPSSTSSHLLALAVGVAASLAGMVRPLFYFLPIWLLLYLLLNTRWSLRSRWTHAFAVSVGPLLILGGWLGYMQNRFQFLAPTVMGGYHLVQHTGGYFEFLPDEEAALRDTYLKYRDAQIAARGTQANAIWDAIPEMSRVSGLSFYDLSRKLQRLSLQLIRDHPGRYARNVLDGWIGFWKAPVYWDPDSFSSQTVSAAFNALRWVGRGLSIAANGLFLLLAAGLLLLSALRRRWMVDRLALFAGGLVLLTSVVQTLADHGDNPRFLVPLQMLVIFVLIHLFWRRMGDRRGA